MNESRPEWDRVPPYFHDWDALDRVAEVGEAVAAALNLEGELSSANAHVRSEIFYRIHTALLPGNDDHDAFAAWLRAGGRAPAWGAGYLADLEQGQPRLPAPLRELAETLFLWQSNPRFAALLRRQVKYLERIDPQTGEKRNVPIPRRVYDADSGRWVDNPAVTAVIEDVLKKLYFIVLRNAAEWRARPDRDYSWWGFIFCQLRAITRRSAAELMPEFDPRFTRGEGVEDRLEEKPDLAPTPAMQVEQSQEIQALHVAFAVLEGDEQLVVRLQMIEQQSWPVVSEAAGLSRYRCQQVLNGAIRKLHRLLEGGVPAQLTLTEQLALELRYWDQQEEHEVAAQLELDPNTCRAVLQAGLAKLRSGIDDRSRD